MSKVFHVVEAQVPTQLERISCKNEDAELQSRLHAQPELLAGDQIRPEDPRRWLLIRREMPVNSPTTGTKDFFLDFLYVDQDGMPTLVEAKRCADPRARREVIGQMLEYAANGRAYWSVQDLVQSFVGTSGGDPQLAAAALKSFRSGGEETLESFFLEVLQKLRDGFMRLIFFLEDSSYELRSIVEFLNQEFETIEVFVVEARQYRLGPKDASDSTIIVPHVIGFSESMRLLKQRNRESKVGAATEKGEGAFWKNLNETLPPDQVESIRIFVDKLQGVTDFRVIWIVSCILLLPDLLPKRGILGIRKNGDLELYFGYWQPTYQDVAAAQVAVRERLWLGLQQLGFVFKAERELGFPTLRPEQWIPKSEALLSLLRRETNQTAV